jgi:hypothetical protein
VQCRCCPAGTVLMGGASIEGVRAFGAIRDEAAGYQALPYFPKSWLEAGPGGALHHDAVGAARRAVPSSTRASRRPSSKRRPHMKVKVANCTVVHGKGLTAGPGTVIEVPKDEAEGLIAKGFASAPRRFADRARGSVGRAGAGGHGCGGCRPGLARALTVTSQYVVVNATRKGRGNPALFLECSPAPNSSKASTRPASSSPRRGRLRPAAARTRRRCALRARRRHPRRQRHRGRHDDGVRDGPAAGTQGRRALTVDGTTYKVRTPPKKLYDGTVSRAELKK